MGAAAGVWGAATCGGGADLRGEIRARPRFADQSAVVTMAPVAYGPRALPARGVASHKAKRAISASSSELPVIRG